MTDAVASPYPVVPESGVPIDAPAGALARFRVAHDEPLRPPLLLAVLAVGVAAATVVVGHEPGLGLAVAGALVWAPAVPALVRRHAWSTLLTASLGVALAAMVAIRAAGWVVVLCLLAAVATSAVAATSARTALGIGLSLPTLPLGASRALTWFWRGTGQALRGRRGHLVRWLRTTAITLGLVAVLGALLASADAVFATLVPSWDLGLLPAQLVVGTLGALGALAALSLTTRPPDWSASTLPHRTPSSRAEWFTPVLAVAALMLAFLVTQLVTAVGGDAYVTRTAGLTYAAYARQGFGQLVAVTALTLLVVAWFAVRAPRGGRHDGWSTRAALGAVCLGALGIVATAMVRLSLYVAAYGLTELRVLAATGEVVMGLTLVLVLAAGVRWRGDWLPLAVVRMAAVVVLGLALANPDALMVTYNTQAQEVPVDVVHLQNLSADAVPAIAALEEPLRSCLLSRHEVPEAGSVWEWNLARSRAAGLDDVGWSDGVRCPS